MLWYGINTPAYCKQLYKRRIYKCNLSIRTLAFPVFKRYNLTTTSVNIYIPSNWNLIVLKSKKSQRINKLLYIFSDIYYFKIAVLETYLKWFFSTDSQTLLLNNFFVPTFYRTYFQRITNIFYSFSRLFLLNSSLKERVITFIKITVVLLLTSLVIHTGFIYMLILYQ